MSIRNLYLARGGVGFWLGVLLIFPMPPAGAQSRGGVTMAEIETYYAKRRSAIATLQIDIKSEQPITTGSIVAGYLDPQSVESGLPPLKDNRRIVISGDLWRADQIVDGPSATTHDIVRDSINHWIYSDGTTKYYHEARTTDHPRPAGGNIRRLNDIIGWCGLSGSLLFLDLRYAGNDAVKKIADPAGLPEPADGLVVLAWQRGNLDFVGGQDIRNFLYLDPQRDYIPVKWLDVVTIVGPPDLRGRTPYSTGREDYEYAADRVLGYVPIRYREFSSGADGKNTIDRRVTVAWKINDPVDPEIFQFHPPAGVRVEDGTRRPEELLRKDNWPPSPAQKGRVAQAEAAAVTPVAAAAPGNAATKSGGGVTMAEIETYYAKRRAAIATLQFEVKSEEAITSRSWVAGFIDLEYLPPDLAPLKNNVRIVISGDRWRADQIIDGPTNTVTIPHGAIGRDAARHYVYSEGTTKLYAEGREVFPKKSAVASIQRFNEIVSRCFLRPAFLFTNLDYDLGGYSVKPDASVKLLDPADAPEPPGALVVCGYQIYGDSEWAQYIYLDPARDYIPVKTIEITNEPARPPQAGVTRRMTGRVDYEYAPDPVLGYILVRYREFHLVRDAESVRQVTISGWKINEPVDSEVFQLRLPAGMRFSDYTKSWEQVHKEDPWPPSPAQKGRAGR